MTIRKTSALGTIAATALLLGWLIGGSSKTANAQAVDPSEDQPAAGYEWRMLGGNVADTGGSGGSDVLTGASGRGVFWATWLYNAKTRRGLSHH